MFRPIVIVLIGCLSIAGCSNRKQDNLPQDRFIQVYFNHRETEDEYIEPYRELSRSGDNLEAIIIQEIAAAKSTIDLAVQELNLPLIAKALSQSHRSGVRVRVILDNQYSRSYSQLNPQEIKQLKPRDRTRYQSYLDLVDLNKDGNLHPQEIAQTDALQILKQAGIPVIDDTADGSQGSGLMHHKFMVVDNKIVLTGSTNFTLSGIHGDLNNFFSRGNVNHLLRIEHDRVASLFTEEFDYMWGEGSEGGINSKFGLQKPWRGVKTFVWQDTKFTIQFAPTSRKKDWQLSTNGLIAKTINNAAESIDLALFVFSEQKIVDALKQLQPQVEIKGVFDLGFAYRYYSEVLDMLGTTLYLRCQPEANNHPWEKPLNTVGTPQIPQGDKLHHKFALIDDYTLISGSQNWSQTANINNDEALIIISNSTVARHFDREFERLYDLASTGLPAKIAHKSDRQKRECS